jgi:hypothetical protein
LKGLTAFYFRLNEHVTISFVIRDILREQFWETNWRLNFEPWLRLQVSNVAKFVLSLLGRHRLGLAVENPRQDTFLHLRMNTFYLKFLPLCRQSMHFCRRQKEKTSFIATQKQKDKTDKNKKGLSFVQNFAKFFALYITMFISNTCLSTPLVFMWIVIELIC